MDRCTFTGVRALLHYSTTDRLDGTDMIVNATWIFPASITDLEDNTSVTVFE